MKRIFLLFSVTVCAFLLLSCGGTSEETKTRKGEKVIADKSPREAYREASSIEDPDKKIAQFRKIMKSFPDSRVVFSSGRQIFNTGLENTSDSGKIKKYAAEYIDSAPEDKKSYVYNEIAFNLAQKEILLSDAEEYASKALEIEKGDGKKSTVGKIYDTLAFTQKKQGKIEKALENQKKAVKKQPYDHGILQRYGEILEETDTLEKAVDAYARAVSVFGEEDKDLEEKLKKLYVKVNGSEEGLSEKLAKLKKKSKKYEILESRRIDGNAPDLTVPSLKGEKKSLSDYKGKIVVLNFWGVWCKWCKKELPQYQKVYKEYKGNDVAFLAVNVEFSGDRKEKDKKVKEYLKSNDLTFPVLMDYERKFPEKYGVEGFPTSFVIGRDGNFKFENRGYSPQYEEILKTQIEQLI